MQKNKTCPHCGALQAKKPKPIWMYVVCVVVAAVAVYQVDRWMRPTMDELKKAEEELDKAIDRINAIQNQLPRRKQ